ncbi:epm2a-interacting protein 1 [Holotrichia oblita]|uniref:Epm2a-interacting protein 1 n=3 Tax=Holotrichia oblita TaxID=644536 RepID=A0ACB9TVH7_HOLOL|nr:epm2a-interacting protein 1 [Holotrichia oblita]KAI4470641.1 epm2a-interacting protein 1 [Holotrichia oblita]KAI4470644.1 epm2a-interacting protein 1 [Holotrichia oblita]
MGICNLIESVSAFRRKLDIFEKDIAKHEFINFPTILEYKKENSEEDIAVFVRFLSDLRDEVATRFQDFAEIGKLSQFLKFPYEVDASAEWTDVAAKLFSVSKASLQVEIIDLQEDISLQMYKTVSTEEFWGKHVSEKYENCKKVAINLATMFVSTIFMRIGVLENEFFEEHISVKVDGRSPRRHTSHLLHPSYIEL